jgi:hypothetical protein
MTKPPTLAQRRKLREFAESDQGFFALAVGPAPGQLGELGNGSGSRGLALLRAAYREVADDTSRSTGIYAWAERTFGGES